MPNIREIYSAQTIQNRIAELGKEISRDYADKEKPVVIGVMKGAFCFLADLVRNMSAQDPLQIEFVRLSSYGAARKVLGMCKPPGWTCRIYAIGISWWWKTLLTLDEQQSFFGIFKRSIQSKVFEDGCVFRQAFP